MSITKKLCAVALTALLCGSAAMADANLRGKVVGKSGQPMDFVNIQLADENGKPRIVSARQALADYEAREQFRRIKSSEQLFYL